ncbi:MAG: hypothetical protein ACKV2Q_36530 [Planctomycetaceae bacterium]
MAPTAIQNLATAVRHDIDVGLTPVEIATAGVTLFGMRIDGSDEEDDFQLKMYHVASAPSVGSALPNSAIPVEAGSVMDFVANGGDGIAIPTGLFIAIAKEYGTAGATPPDNDVKVTVWTSA